MSQATELSHPAAPRPGLRAALNFLVPGGPRPRNYTYDPPPGEPRSNAQYAPHLVEIADARHQGAALELDRQGFAFVPHTSAVRDFGEEDEIRRVYYPESAALLARVTGASRVHVFDHTLRRRVEGADDRATGQPRQPASRVHVDQTVKSGPERLRFELPDEADALLRGRAEIINVWRPIVGPLWDSPLALCDARSVDPEDLVASDLIFPDRIGETYAVTYNPAQRWSYFPGMTADEVLLIKCWDTAEDGRARFAPHGAFVDPTAPWDAPPRQSIELRAFVFHEVPAG